MRSVHLLLIMIFALCLPAAGTAATGLRSGTEIVPVGAVQQHFAQEATYPGVGYRYQHVGIAGVDLWTWDGEYCTWEKIGSVIYYDPVSIAEAARLIGVSEQSLERPAAYRYPVGFWIIIACFAFWFWRSWKRRARESGAKRKGGRQRSPVKSSASPPHRISTGYSADSPRWDMPLAESVPSTNPAVLPGLPAGLPPANQPVNSGLAPQAAGDPPAIAPGNLLR